MEALSSRIRLDLSSVKTQDVLDRLLTWQGTTGVVAAVAVGYIVVTRIPRKRAKKTLLELKPGSIPFEKVAAVYDEYDKSYGRSRSSRTPGKREFGVSLINRLF
jgi:hypothetical protein